ncbi:MAG TPA: alpha/beta hydrolase-fold protein [Labilithrix sp.]|nr:alpha/beta hydrolase-fold protein [Labilithrix sp.]
MRRTFALAAMMHFAVACSAGVVPDEGGRENRPVGPAETATPSPGQGDSKVPAAAATIRVHYPAGSQAIGLRGEGGSLPADKSTPMTAAADDTWELALGAIEQPVHFTPMLGDKPARGPSYKVLPGQTVDVYPYFIATKGTVAERWPKFESKARGNTRVIRTYVPPSYEENTRKRYPVVYMHDGQYLFTGSTLASKTECLLVEKTLDEGIEAGTIAETIIVGIDSSPLTRMTELTPTKDGIQGGGGGPDYVKMMADELKPRVDAELRTLPDRDHTFTMGQSLGGLASAFASIARPEVFGGFASQSPSYWWDDRIIIGQAKTAFASAPRASKIYVDYGDKETIEPDMTSKLIEPVNEFLGTVRDAGYVDDKDLLFVLGPSPAEHKATSWAPRMPKALTFLVGAGR